MNRKLKIITGIFALFYSLAGFCDVPNQVNLHYTGNVVSRPCSISVGETTTLDLGDIDTSAMQNVGDATPWSHLTVRFFNCDIETNIVISSSGNNVAPPIFGPASSQGFAAYQTSTDFISNAIYLEAYATVDNLDTNLAYFIPNWGIPPIIITPSRRALTEYTSYDLLLKFRFVRGGITSENVSGNYYGVYILTVEYK